MNPSARGATPVTGIGDLNIEVTFDVSDADGDTLPYYLPHMAAKVVETAMTEIQKNLTELGIGLPAEPESIPWIAMRKGVVNAAKAAKVAEKFGIPIGELMADAVWVNDRYTVSVRKVEQAEGGTWPGMAHLNDRAACRDWRDFQRIKNDIFGPECEGVELYPAESRLADGANQYHIWVLTEPGVKFPFGFADRLVGGVDSSDGLGKQRDWADADRPADLVEDATYPARQRVFG